jgi:hypothetical protein
MLRWLVRLLLAVFALAVLVIGLEMVAAESGEVVVLRTTDDSGATHETRLWVVEHEGRSWLRAGNPEFRWVAHLRARPEIEVVRRDVPQAFRATPTVEAREPVNRLMREKYGWADAYISALFGRDDAVPIRLDPR